MYFVDRKLLDTRLGFLKEVLAYTEQIAQVPQSKTEQLAYERAIHLLIECILDIGNQMIDGFIMRDPGSYEDIIDILEDEQVIYDEVRASLKQLIQLRKLLVSQYTELDIHNLWQTYQQAKAQLRLFPDLVRGYLENELGPVSAFTPE